MSNYTHLVISGGGLYGICMLGVFRYLYIEKKLINIKNIAGNSIGSFFALAYCLNIDIETLENMIKDLACNKSLLITKKNFGNIFLKNGILSFDVYTNKLKDYLKDKYKLDDLTFVELTKKFGINLYISATNINLGKNTIFSTDTTPNISVFTATCASMSIPYFSKPVLIDEEYYVDGLLTNNFPVNIFKNVLSENILGIAIKISSEYILKTYNKKKNFTFIEYNKRLFEILLLNSSNTTFLKSIDKTNKNILVIEDSPITDMLLINIDKDSIKTCFTNNDIDNLILDGFIKAHTFFNDIKSS